MSALRKPEVRGACPGALRPMESGDGLIVRVRPRAGVLGMDQAFAIADAARRYGNGEIDLTRRANLQLRGIRAETLPAVQKVLAERNLLDATPEAEAIRNIIVSPFASYIVGDQTGPRSIARDLEEIISDDERLWRLTPKFGFVIDDGDTDALEGVPGDLFLRCIGRGDYALGVDGLRGIRWIGEINGLIAAEALASAAIAFVETQPSGSRLRLRTAGDEIVGALEAVVGGKYEVHPLPRMPRAPRLGSRLGEVLSLVGVGVPFGRISADTLIDVCDAASMLNATHLRLSPWRALYFPVHHPDAVAALLSIASGAGLMTEDDDPIAHIDACPGAPACPCAALDTREAARKLAMLFGKLAITSAHVSGCPKGCARSKAADLVLVGGETDFGIIRNGRADATPERRIASNFESVEELIDG